MQRRTLRPREGWQRLVEEQGLVWHTQDGRPYWDESAAYVFTMAEIETLETAAERLHELFLEAGDHLVRKPERLSRFGLQPWVIDAIRAEWKRDRPALDYGRFDFGWDGSGEPKLFEYNCDTPTAMLECGVVQWAWKEEVFPQLDQFTSLHDKLIARFRFMARDLPGGRLWVTHMDDDLHEDTLTATYMRDLAAQAGLETHGVLIERIGIDVEGRIVDEADQLITALFKLYPWEWIVAEDYGRDIVRRLDATLWLEPIWKMLWSNKAILPLLWELSPDHPNLLAAGWSVDQVGPNHVIKPILAREGANVALVEDGREVLRSAGPYGDTPCVYQEAYSLPAFNGSFPVLGVWTVGGEAAGLGIREGGRITGDEARFIPHIIEG